MEMLYPEFDQNQVKTLKLMCMYSVKLSIEKKSGGKNKEREREIEENSAETLHTSIL